MSPASKSKSRVKSTQKAAKEQSKGSLKATQVPSNGGNVSTSGAHNPHLTTLKLFEASPLSAPSETQSNGRLRTTDDQDVNSGSSPTTADYDSISINGSCSGESEDHKEKITCPAPRTETIPGFDNDKKDKNKLKNERKHQRQKERRAQELHERCIGFLTSRKFEALSHQLIAMGFSSDRANMALIANEGRMEESVAWLLLDGEENKQPTAVDLDDKSNAKIDISCELSRIEEMVTKYKCTKQEVERAVVSCEGDLLKAEESLRVQKQVNKVTELAKLDESADSSVLTNKVPVPNQYSLLTRNSLNGIQQKEREERDLNYTKPIASEPLSHESVYRSLQQSLKRPQPKPATLSSRMQSLAADKRLLTSTSMVPVSYSLSSSAVPVSEPLEVPQPQFGLTLGQEVKAGFHAGVLKEPFVMQRANQNLPSTAATGVSPPVSAGWHSGSVPSMEMKTSDSVSFGPNLPNIGTSASVAQQYYHRNSSRPESFDPNQYYGLSGLHSRSLNASGSTSSSLAVPSSLGLFSGWASSGLSDSSSQNDWNTGSLKPTLDYTSIDWSLDSTPLQTSAKCGGLSNTWSTMFMGGKVTRPPRHDHRNGWYIPQPQEGSVGPSKDPSSLPVGSHEWANTFEGRDLFHVPRYYVTPPSL